ncbi:hypothetical protein GUJ93_ZPchr0012g20256 [Zizania palustris]|uniref:Uncharacterized protein n=1 Tax=Zizania palustris TaxID=103762 RepID=A0A8J5WQ53_ZIZPA|nr:hypothetical protein GUJ93_ZPchr0012g20256 [Zizania palustris]KAG8092704.1 hypothetical protein GUJ93_ZPchr0012g20256 [Zizania palustris]
MDPFSLRAFRDLLCTEDNIIQHGIERCPFLRNINEPTSFSFLINNFPTPARGSKGPIFEDGPNFDAAFRVFHGQDGVVPLSGESFAQIEKPLPKPNPEFNPLAAKAATISLSAFGGFFSFGDFSNKRNKKNINQKKPNNLPQNGGKLNNHEALNNEWLEMGQCPMAKSYRALSGVVPLVAKMMTPPAGMKLRCPRAIVAARAALSNTAFAKELRPQPLPTKMLVIALLGMAANVPLGVWREHTEKFSVQWFAAVHGAVPFIGMLRKSVLMPKTAMVLTIAASILGQTIGSRAERIRLKRAAAQVAAAEGQGATTTGMSLKTGRYTDAQLWDPLTLRVESSMRSGSPVLVPTVGAFH